MKALSFLTKLREQAGFTMIELLIVIAILGILAVAVLSAINPVEQINRGRDTGSQSDAEQLLSAIDRFNAFQGFYPWQDGADDQDYDVAFTEWSAFDALANNGGTCNVSELLSAGDDADCTGSNELKVSFFTRIFDTNYNSLFIYHGTNASDSTYICFVPRSDAFKVDANKRCGVSYAGLPDDLQAIGSTICAGVDNSAADSYICIP